MSGVVTASEPSWTAPFAGLTLRQLAPLFGIARSAAGRIIDHLGPSPALQSRNRFRGDTVPVVDGTLVPIRDHTGAEQPKDHRYPADHRVIIDR